MLDPQKILEEAASLSIEARAQVVDGLLKTLHRPDDVVDGQWAQEATRRLRELRQGNITGVPATEVLEKARKRLGQ